MPGRGTVWDRERTKYKAECKAANAQCWLCHGTKGPIDYNSKFDPAKPNRALFTVDHITPTSQGADPLRKANWAPAHAGCNFSRGNGTRQVFPTSRQW